MDKSGSTIDQVKNGAGAVMDSAREIVNDGADNLDRLYRGTVAQVRGTSERISENAREQLDGVRHFARKRYRKARKKVSRLSGDARDYVSDNPSWSLLIAAAIGFFAVQIVRRRLGA